MKSLITSKLFRRTGALLASLLTLQQQVRLAVVMIVATYYTSC